LSEQNLWSKIKPRDGKIPLDKVGKAWNTLKELMNSPVQTPAGRTIADATAFIMLTGCRLNEAAALTWDHINIKDKWWHLDDPKNHRAVTFPLSETAIQTINDRPKINEFIFASKGKLGHITEIRTPMIKISEAIGYKISAHDLRRTFKAIAVENQIEKWKFDLLTNHQASEVSTKHYLETSDLKYLKSEINIIAEWIKEQATIAASENVIPMPDKKRA